MKKRSRSLAPHANGFTLMEVLMALALLGLVVASGYEALRSGLLRLEKLHQKAEGKESFEIAFALMAKDLRSAFLTSDNRQTQFVGHHEEESPGDRIEFTKLRPESSSEETFDHIRYHLEENRQTGQWDLWRATDEKKVLLCPNVVKFEARYFDGNEWREEWGWDASEKRPFTEIRGLPLVISLHLVFHDGKGRSGEETKLVPVMVSLLNRVLHV